MPSYEKIKSPEPHGILEDVLERYRDDLREAEVSIALVWAYHGENDPKETPCLKHGGYSAAAIVKINSVRARVEGLTDATIAICFETWKSLTDAERVALIDHEVHHLELVRDDEGAIKSDDHGRPKLKMRLHDYQVGAFREIIERHGENSLDLQQIRKLADMDVQLLLPMGEDASVA